MRRIFKNDKHISYSPTQHNFGNVVYSVDHTKQHEDWTTFRQGVFAVGRAIDKIIKRHAKDPKIKKLLLDIVDDCTTIRDMEVPKKKEQK